MFNGVFSAITRASFTDRSLTALACSSTRRPTFLLGMPLLYFLYFRLTAGRASRVPGRRLRPVRRGLDGWAQHLVLPWFTLALVSAATYTRLTRASMLDVLGEDYVRTARAKGISRAARGPAARRCAARSRPVVTQFGIDVGALLGGVVVTETVFSLPGLGNPPINAINQQDLPVIIGMVLLASAAVVVANILVDLLYAVLDPRVRLS